MDIRNFFGKKKKKASPPPAGGGSAAPPPPKRPRASPSASRGGGGGVAGRGGRKAPASTPASSAAGGESERAAADGGGGSGSDTEMEGEEGDVVVVVAAPEKTTRGDGGVGGKKKAAAARRAPATAVAGARGVDDGGSETEMEDEEEENVENNSSGVEKGKGGARGRGSRVAREDDDGNDDGDDAANDDGNDDDGDATTDDEPPKRRAAAEGKGKRKVALASDSSDDDDDEKKKIAPAADSGDDDEEEESSPRRRRSPRKRGGRRVVAAGDSDEDEEEDFGAKKRSSVRRGGGAKKVGTFGDGNDNDGNDNDNGDDVGVGDGDDDVDDDDDDDNDGDFKPQAAGGDDSSGAEEVVVPARRPGKRRASSSPPRRSSPRKKQASPRKKAAPEPKRAAVPRDPAVPPKYHPPSSRLLQRMPFLANDPSVSVRVALTLPKLPGDGGDPTFPLDDFTPRCLEGSTFVFTGILSTNPEKTRAANRELQLASPGKGDYYAHRNLDSGCAAELSREAAADVVKSLGGKATTSVSGKTDYLVCGSVLEDGREVEEGSKHRRATELWEIWETKWRGDYEEEGGGGRGKDEKKKAKKKRTKAQLKDRDPNSLVEIIRGVDEFYGLVASLSEWKRGTLSEEERKALDAGRPRRKASAEVVRAEATSETKPEVKEEPTTPANPRGGAPAPTRAAARNPYAPRPSSAAAAPPADNPYARKASPVANPYARKASPANPYAKKPAASSSSYAGPVKSDRPGRPLHPATGKELLPHSLWADKYAPSSTSEILGNADSVTKLRRWLSSWEDTFNDPQRPVKGLTNPGGPKKAALLSGPPGIGKTTTATLVARESGRDVLELNASDARSKKALGQALGDVTGSHVLSFERAGGGGGGTTKKTGGGGGGKKLRRCIVMDEVDGMGAGDRSGMSELIQMIKGSKVPIICICNDRSSQKMKSLVQYCLDLRYRRPTKSVIARRAVEIGRLEGMDVEPNAAEAVAESCGNDIRQVLNCLQMWSCNGRSAGGRGASSMSYRDLKERQGAINKDEVLRVSMFDACRSIVEGPRGLAGSDSKAVRASLMKRTDAFFVDYMLMGLMVQQNYLKVCVGQYSAAKLKGDDDAEVDALSNIHDAALAMSDFGMCEESLRGGDQNWSLLPLCSVLAVKVGHHAGGPAGGVLPGYPEFAGWLGKNSTRNKKVRVLRELARHVNYKVSADAPELRMNYLPLLRQKFETLLFDGDGARVAEAIALMDEYGLDRDDVFENLDEFLFNSKGKKFGDLDGKSKSAFTRAYNATAHRAQALVAEQGAGKTGRKRGGVNGGGSEPAELDVVDDDKAAAGNSDDEDEDEDLEELKKKFLKKGRGSKGKATASTGKGKGATSKTNGKRRKK